LACGLLKYQRVVKKGHVKKFKHFVSVFVFVFSPNLLFSAVHSQKSQAVSYQAPLKLFFKKQSELNAPAQSFSKPDQTYETVFGGLDAQIAIQYHDQWGAHEQNLPYRSSSWRGEFLTNQVQNGSPTYDWQARENFAKQVFRMRVERGVREYLKQIKASQAIAKAQGALESLREVSVPVSSGSSESSGKSSGRLQVGYDLLSDSSKVEYVGGPVDMGFYKNGILSQFENSNTALMQVSSEVSPEIGRLSLSAPLSGTHIQTSLSKQLSSQIAASVSAQQSLKPGVDSSYYWNMAFSF